MTLKAILPQHSLLSQLDATVFDTQTNCPFFSVIPPEIREKIFSFALLKFDTKPYPVDAHYRRPGYTHHQRIDTCLLQTCRLIYSETHDIVVSQNEHVFWSGADAGPSIHAQNAIGYFTRMTAEQRQAVVKVHFFGSPLGRRFRNSLQFVCEVQKVRIRHVKITFPHGEWRTIPAVDSNLTKIIVDPVFEEIQQIRDLERLDIEIECRERYETQLNDAANALFKRTFNIPRARTLTTDGNPVSKRRYRSTIDTVLAYDPSIRDWGWVRSYQGESASIGYVMINITWSAKPRLGSPVGPVVPRGRVKKARRSEIK